MTSIRDHFKVFACNAVLGAAFTTTAIALGKTAKLGHAVENTAGRIAGERAEKVVGAMVIRTTFGLVSFMGLVAIGTIQFAKSRFNPAVSEFASIIGAGVGGLSWAVGGQGAVESIVNGGLIAGFVSTV